MNAIKLLRELNPFAQPPTVDTLLREELVELQRELYLEDKRADHHRAQANALNARITKIETALAAVGK